MNHEFPDAHRWLGLCRKPPVFHASLALIDDSPSPVHEGIPDGGAGGSRMVPRGIGAALSGTKMLAQNRQLLWFTLLAGLVLAGNTIGQAALRSIRWIMQPDIIVSYGLDFLLGFATLFCLVFLLAGLVLSISSKKAGPASFFEGLAGAKKYKKSIFLWSLVLALAGLLLERMYVYFAIIWFPHELGFLYAIGDGFFISTITQFPFNWTLDWNMLTEIPGYGGRSLLLWIYPFGFMETLQFSAITLLLFVLTPFVVPLVVLEQKTLREAVVGSFVLMKKTWAEVATCALFLGVTVSGVFLTHLLIQAVSGIVDPYQTVIFHPPGTWVALALLYNLALLTIAFVVATVGGIASLNLYTNAKTGQIPGSADTKSPA
ncbi:MAG TPA: DUF6159 family protein [Methanoregulaceae archaeon]|nr:DUF6159 family protein [Methanoregulaceae archaeon]